MNKKRLLVFYLSCFVFMTAVLFIGASTVRLSPSRAEWYRNLVIGSAKSISVAGVFKGNFEIAFVGSLPVAGIIFEPAVMFNTGVAFSAFSLPLSYLVHDPFVWTETPMYSLAFLCSILTVYFLVKQRWKEVYEALFLTWAVTSVGLFISAILEVWYIKGYVIW